LQIDIDKIAVKQFTLYKLKHLSNLLKAHLLECIYKANVAGF